MRAVSSGSSEKDSKVRPASGVRTMHTVGPEQHVHVLGAGLGGQHIAELAHELGVPLGPDGVPQGCDSERRPMGCHPGRPRGHRTP